VFYDTAVTFGEFADEAERVAGFLEGQCGVRKGDRVLLFMQNSPQFAIAYYGILRANAVVVPINPMCQTQELAVCEDCGRQNRHRVPGALPAIEPLAGSEIGITSSWRRTRTI
jgi:fatty-acyl-CoA synthase